MVDKRGIKGLLMNLIIPGLGTIFLENKKHGQLQLSIFLLPIAISLLFGSFLNKFIATSSILPVIFALIMLSMWLWALIFSIKYLTKKEETIMQEDSLQQ